MNQMETIELLSQCKSLAQQLNLVSQPFIFSKSEIQILQIFQFVLETDYLNDTTVKKMAGLSDSEIVFLTERLLYLRQRRAEQSSPD